MHYLVYEIVNTTNGKIYVGAHQTLDIDDKYYGSGVAIKRALSKYGKDIFIKRILRECATVDEMYDFEKTIVTPEFVARDDTYNLTVGGRGSQYGKLAGRKPTIEQRTKMRKPKSETTRENIRKAKLGDKNPQFGIPLTDETKRKMSAKLKGRVLSKGHVNAVVESYKNTIRKRPGWCDYEKIFELWKSVGKPKSKKFAKIAIEHGYPDMSYLRMVGNFIKDEEIK